VSRQRGEGGVKELFARLPYWSRNRCIMKQTLFALLLILSVLVRAATAAYPVPVQDRLPVGSGRCQQTVKVSNREGAAFGAYDLPDPECGTFAGGDVWLVADAPASGKLVVGGAYSDFSLTRMAFYAHRKGELVLLACGNPQQLHQVPETRLSDLEPGEAIFVRIWDAGNDETGVAVICAYDPEGVIRPARRNPSDKGNLKVQASLENAARPAFPNPAGQGLSVPLATSEQHAKVVLTDMSGRVVSQCQACEQELVHLNLGNLQDGLYVLRVESLAGIRTELLRVQR